MRSDTSPILSRCNRLYLPKAMLELKSCNNILAKMRLHSVITNLLVVVCSVQSAPKSLSENDLHCIVILEGTQAELEAALSSTS